jgi:hypothetical protein
MRTDALLGEFRNLAPVSEHRGAYCSQERTSMATNADAQNGTDSRVRDSTITLGEDERGALHIYRPHDELVHVVTADGKREHVEDVAGRPVEDWMAFVEDRRGWEDKRYGVGLAEMAARVLGGH